MIIYAEKTVVKPLYQYIEKKGHSEIVSGIKRSFIKNHRDKKMGCRDRVERDTCVI